jgi:hypothetical protein
MATKLCKDCGLRDPSRPVCLLRREQIDPEKDFCSKFTNELPVCSLCNTPFLPPGVYLYNNPEDTEFEVICENCCAKMGTCGLCVHNAGCLFEQENFCPEEPIMVMITERKGNMIIQQQIPNIKRIKKVCPQCSCYYKEDGEEFGICARRNCNTCSNFKMKGDQ